MTTATKTDLHTALVEAFRTAKSAADEAGRDTEDGGTCNLDSPAFRLPRVRDAAIQAAAAEAGVRVSDFTWFGGKRWYWLLVSNGQGSLRSRMSRAADKALEAANVPGMEVCEYCQMD